MFEQTFVQAQAQTRRPWTVAVSLTVQCVVVLLLLPIPLLHPETLGLVAPPNARLITTWINQPPPPPAVAQAVAHTTATLSAPADPRPFLYPVAPTHSASIAPVAAPPEVAMPSAWAGPVGLSIGPALTSALPPPVAPVAPKPPVVNSGPVRVSQGVEGAKLVFNPRPVYPRIAIETRSQGVVRLEAIIGADGKIRNLRVLSGSALLVNAALDAVKQWRYQPTMLNGVAVEVLTEIEVNFTLTRQSGSW
jgi:protein TonB